MNRSGNQRMDEENKACTTPVHRSNRRKGRSTPNSPETPSGNERARYRSKPGSDDDDAALQAAEDGAHGSFVDGRGPLRTRAVAEEEHHFLRGESDSTAIDDDSFSDFFGDKLTFEDAKNSISFSFISVLKGLFQAADVNSRYCISSK